jgi:anion transporter
MTTQMIICLVIFVATLVSYILNKIPMWLTAMLSLAALYATGCITASDALSGFSNTNTILMATMFVVAAGFRRTSLVNGMCNAIMKLTRGNFTTAYFGYILIAVLLTNFIASPMVVYAIVSPLLAALCDTTGHSRSQYMFPIMVVCVSCCGILPLATAIQMAGQFTGFMESYGFAGMTFEATTFFKGAWPVLIVVPLWALFIGPKMTPKQPVVPIEALAKKAAGKEEKPLSPLVDKLGIITFFATILCLIFSSQLGQATWFIALLGSLAMVLFGVVDQKSALRDIPWDMLMLFVGALALGSGLTNTGAGDMIGNALANAVGGTHNNYVLGALFFIIPFLLTQFMLNRSVSAVFVPICLLTCSALGADPTGLILLVNAGSLTAFLTPMATPAVPMCMADGGYDLKSLIKSGALITVILPIVYIFYTMTVLPAF